MIEVKICVGSSCHLKGSEELIDMILKRIESGNLKDKIELSGSFCLGKCNRVGVTIEVNGCTYTGINKENFEMFWHDKILPILGN